MIQISLRPIGTAILLTMSFIDALKKYHHDIKAQAGLCSYNEIVDFSCVSKIDLSVKEILLLASIAVQSDIPTSKTKLALVVSSNMAFCFAKMYKKYRSTFKESNKELGVFRVSTDALGWVNKE